jgi:hypothetical protein
MIPDTYGFPRTKPDGEFPRTKRFIIRGGPSKGERRSATKIRKGSLYKVRGQTQREKGLSIKRPYGIATGDLVRRSDGKVGRVVAAKADGLLRIRTPGEVDSQGKEIDVTERWKKVTLISRVNGYHLYW